MEWKGNFAGESIEEGFSRLVEDRLYVGDGLGTAYVSSDAATVMSTGTIPANTLQVGDLLLFEGAVIVSSITSTPTLVVKFEYGIHNGVLTHSAKAAEADDTCVWNFSARVKAISPSLDLSHTSELWHIDSDALGSSVIVAANAMLTGPGASYKMYATDAADFKVTLTWSAAAASNSATVVRNHVHILRPERLRPVV